MITPKDQHRYSRQLVVLKRFVSEGQKTPADVISSSLCFWAGSGLGALPSGWAPAKGVARRELQGFLQFLGDLSFDDAAFFLSSAYSDLVEPTYRKREAMFFTPPLLARSLLEDCESFGAQFDQAHFCDPACGGSAFLLPTATRINAELKRSGKTPKQRLVHIQFHLTGIEKDPFLARLATAFLHLLLAEEIHKAGFQPTFQIEAKDTLSETDRWNRKFDVVLCNPPYRKLSKAETAMLPEHYAALLPGQPNLYALFMIRCISLVRDGGHMAWITPSSFLSGTSFAKLRSRLRRGISVKQIGMVASKTGVFRKVEQELTVTHLQMKPSRSKTRVIRIDSEALRERVTTLSLPSGGEVWTVPRTEATARALSKVKALRWRLSDFGYVPRIGYCVHNRDMADRLETLSDFQKRTTAYPMIWAHHIASGARFVPEWGQEAGTVQVGIDYGFHDHKAILRRPAVLLQRVTSNDMKLRLVGGVIGQDFLDEYGGYVAENHVIALEQITTTSEFPPELMSDVLRQPILNQVLSCYSAASNITIYELSRLPMPDPMALLRLVRSGCSVNEAVEGFWQ